MTRGIAHALVLKQGDLYFLCEQDGSVPLRGEHGCGLYYHDCRFLDGYEWQFGGVKPDMLASTATSGFKAIVELTNPDFKSDRRLIRKEQLGIKWERILDDSSQALYDTVTFSNHGLETVQLPLQFTFQSKFEPVFSVRGLLGTKLGKLRPPFWRDSNLHLTYQGADQIERSVAIHFSAQPRSAKGATARFLIKLQPGENKHLQLSIFIAERRSSDSLPAPKPAGDFAAREERLQSAWEQWSSTVPEVSSDSSWFNHTIGRSLRDLHLLRLSLTGASSLLRGCPGSSLCLAATA